ncbi:MAG: MCP four helix bundle domain-containing protein, partial [Microvirgula sp.]
MKISTKLYGMAAISLIGLVTMLGTLYVQMAVVDQRIVDATQNAQPSLVIAEEVKAHYLEARRQAMIHAASLDLAGKKEAEQGIQSNLDTLLKDLHSYKNTLIINDEDHANVEATLSAVKKWQTSMVDFLALSGKGTVEGNTAALQFSKDKITPIAAEAYAAIDKMVEFNKTLGTQSGLEAVQAGQNAKWTLLALGLTLLAVITGSSLWVAFSVKASLGKLEDKIVAITSERNLTLRVDDSGKDEIAHIASRFNQLLQMLQTSFV